MLLDLPQRQMHDLLAFDFHSVQIFSCDKDAQNQVFAGSSFFRCSTDLFHWNKGSTGLLIVSQPDVVARCVCGRFCIYVRS
ncbi:unnamed protein product [Triticum turgidum subsp. durum]|uniref:Uncharacterized protein n=2 Tax=Triticum TaxID=4564 RepID=A0A9R1QGM6_TRITD|nr:unnamed protein product [Triticum aestivum]VAH76255.1 unnamed protein product [Triticum turgidum subsp. durum]